MPVFGGGDSLFQPVYVEDVARAIEVLARDDQDLRHAVAGKIVEAGGPDGEFTRHISTMKLIGL